MIKILGIDFETQGLDLEQSNPTEVGAMLVEISPGEPDQYAFTKVLSSLLWEPGYPPQSEAIVELTGITDSMLKAEGNPPGKTFSERLFPLMNEADIVVAHNKNFDKGILDGTCKRNSLTPPDKRWLCTWSEIPYPSTQQCKKLSHLGLDYGVKMDGRVLHRATDDVKLMLELLAKFKITEVIAYADEPNIIVRAVIPAPWSDGGQGKENATRRGYSWESPRNTVGLKFDKCWVRQIKASQLDKEIENAPFKVVKLQ